MSEGDKERPRRVGSRSRSLVKDLRADRIAHIVNVRDLILNPQFECAVVASNSLEPSYSADPPLLRE